MLPGLIEDSVSPDACARGFGFGHSVGRTVFGKLLAQPFKAMGVVLFEGVCFNSHHLGPRRAWKGGSEPQLLTPDPRDPRMNSKSCKFVVFLLRYLVTRVTLRCNVFLTFSWTSNLKHLLLRDF